MIRRIPKVFLKKGQKHCFQGKNAYFYAYKSTFLCKMVIGVITIRKTRVGSGSVYYGATFPQALFFDLKSGFFTFFGYVIRDAFKRSFFIIKIGTYIPTDILNWYSKAILTSFSKKTKNPEKGHFLRVKKIPSICCG